MMFLISHKHDIMEFLRDNYDNAELMSQEEYDEHFKKENKEYTDILDIDYDK